MIEDLKGFFCTSLAGHDKGRVYYITEEDDIYIYLCDGDLRPLSKPKKKKKRHVRLIKTRKNPLTDSEIRKYIKEINQDVQS